MIDKIIEENNKEIKEYIENIRLRFDYLKPLKNNKNKKMEKIHGI